MPNLICSRPEFNELDKRSHNSALAVVGVRCFEYLIVRYMSVMFSVGGVMRDHQNVKCSSFILLK